MFSYIRLLLPGHTVHTPDYFIRFRFTCLSRFSRTCRCVLSVVVSCCFPPAAHTQKPARGYPRCLDRAGEEVDRVRGTGVERGGMRGKSGELRMNLGLLFCFHRKICINTNEYLLIFLGFGLVKVRTWCYNSAKVIQLSPNLRRNAWKPEAKLAYGSMGCCTCLLIVLFKRCNIFF